MWILRHSPHNACLNIQRIIFTFVLCQLGAFRPHWTHHSFIELVVLMGAEHLTVFTVLKCKTFIQSWNEFSIISYYNLTLMQMRVRVCVCAHVYAGVCIRERTAHFGTNNTFDETYVAVSLCIVYANIVWGDMLIFSVRWHACEWMANPCAPHSSRRIGLWSANEAERWRAGAPMRALRRVPHTLIHTMAYQIQAHYIYCAPTPSCVCKRRRQQCWRRRRRCFRCRRRRHRWICIHTLCACEICVGGRKARNGGVQHWCARTHTHTRTRMLQMILQTHHSGRMGSVPCALVRISTEPLVQQYLRMLNSNQIFIHFASS